METNILQTDYVQKPEERDMIMDPVLSKPAADIVEAKEEWHIWAEMPGVDESSLDITVDRDQLLVEGRASVPKMDSHTLVHGEYEERPFRRRFTLTDEVHRDGIGASLKNGVLHLTIPKTAKATPRRIAVSVEHP